MLGTSALSQARVNPLRGMSFAPLRAEPTLYGRAQPIRLELSHRVASSSPSAAPPGAPHDSRPSTSICCSGGHAFGQSHCCPLACEQKV